MVNIDKDEKEGKTKVGNLLEFCKACASSNGYLPINTIKSFVASHVKYTDFDHDIRWPAEIFEKKVGICGDFSILMHEVFSYFNIPHAIGFAEFFNLATLEYGIGHVYPIFKWDEYDGQYWIWNYYGDRPNEYAINGPFTSYDYAATYAAPYFLVLYGDCFAFNSFANKPAATYGMYLADQELNFIDDYYNQKMNFNELTLKDSNASQKILINRLTFRKQFTKIKEFRTGIGWQLLPTPTLKESPITFKSPSKDNINKCIKTFNSKFGNVLNHI